MRISDIKIRNFRKFKEISIDLRDDTTVFIGSNNSGKTSALVAMRYFLKKEGFNIYDFTISNHAKIREIGAELEKDIKPDNWDLSLWKDILPSFDLWFDVGDNDIHYVSHILPTLDWVGGNLGIRLIYEPKNLIDFYNEYLEVRSHSKELKAKADNKKKLKNIDLFPKDMVEFLSRHLQKCFTVKYYILDPAKKNEEQNILSDPIDENPLNGLIQIDEITAQRGLNDEVEDISTNDKKRLSQQLKEYYKKHIDPSKDPTENDIEALEAIYIAQQTFTESMAKGFQHPLKELGTLGYPGFYNPNIKINPELKPTDGLDHDAALQYELNGCKDSFLPETYNGLGYQNLIFMAFKLIQFRDSWLKIGKQKTSQPTKTNIEYPPIHLVLIEEPEAHLHPQAQQVFIKQAYNILINKPEIKAGKLMTQLVVTTHSSHVTHECEFANLRYFKRIQPVSDGEVQSSSVVNLSTVFGSDRETEKFIARYIKITHCDLFFADAGILIEGDAERILLPSFIRKIDYLNQSYISILSIGGSHAHKFRSFFEVLEIPILIITDLDATEEINENGEIKWKSASVVRKNNQKTNNDTLKTWIPQKESIDDLLALSTNDKMQETPFPLRVAFQTPIHFNGSEVLPYTFEDSLIFENKTMIDGVANVKGMLQRVKKITDAKNAFDMIRNHGFKKAEFALDLLFLPDFDNVKVPTYILEGLQWLESVLKPKLAQTSFNQNSVGKENVK